MVYKILIWGTGKGYNACLSSLKYMETIGDISIVRLTSDDNYYSFVDGIKFIPKAKLRAVDFDYVIVAANNAYYDIYTVAVSLGIDKEKIISSKALFLENFSFKKYTQLIKIRFLSYQIIVGLELRIIICV